jgi:prepilin-type N-terminal cleavage/methylation domain-containing protein
MKEHAKNNQTGFTLIEFIVGLVIAAIMASTVYTFFGNALTKGSETIWRLQKTSNLQQVMENIVADFNRLNKINMRYSWKPSTPYQLNYITTGSGTILGNGHYYKCTTAGSNATEPNWQTTSGGVTTTAGAIWTESGYVWKASTSYPASAIVVPFYNNGHFYRGPSSPNPFTSSGSEPTHTGSGATILQWTEAGTILSSNVVSDNLYSLLPAVNDPILVTETDAARTRYGKGYTVTEKVFIRFIPVSGSWQEDTVVTEYNILKVTIKDNDPNSELAQRYETLTQLFTIR